MEGSSGSGAPFSAVERLKQLQAQAMNQAMQSEPSADQFTSTSVPQSSTAEPEAVSPSDLLSTVEGDAEQQSAQGSAPAPVWLPDAAQQLPMGAEGSSEAAGQVQSAGEDLDQGIDMNLDFGAPVMPSLEQRPDQSFDQEQIPATIAPSALMTSAEAAAFSLASPPAAGLAGPALAGIAGSTTSEESSRPPEEPILPDTHARNEFIVTLPLPANLRPVYRDILTQNFGLIESFTEASAAGRASGPDEGLLQDIDEMLQRLTDVCDLPAFLDAIPPMGPEAMMKYARDTNSKFSFVYELLESLRNVDRKVLILAKSGRVTEFLDALLSTEAFNYRHANELETHQGNPEKPLEVVLASTDRDASELPASVDVVIAFDMSARASGLVDRYETPNHGPIILSLIITNSLEHIDLRISRALDPLERRNALVMSVNQARGPISDPERAYLEPHVTAERFSKYIQEPSPGFVWEPQSVPDEVFDAYLTSHAHSRKVPGLTAQADLARATSRKRHFVDDAGSGTSTPKRARMTGTEEPGVDRVSEQLRHLLGNHIWLNGKTAEVPLERLEFLAKKVHDLEHRLKQKQSVEDTVRVELASQVAQKESHVKTVRKFHLKYMEALRDRGTFEVERDRARQDQQKAQAQLEKSNAAVASLTEEKKGLEAQLAEAREALRSSAVPEAARLAELEAQRRADAEAAESLRKRLATLQGDLEYSRQMYQDASSSAARLGNENRELAGRAAELERRAADTLREVHRLHAEGEAAALRRLWEDERAVRQERERDLARARDELRLLKNGRRETRATSVPRSPRLGVMSPRTSGRGGNGGGGGGNGAHGAAAGSRGTSPASGADAGLPMAFFHPHAQPQANGSGRWGGSHLRE